jgi:hypothetical protein
VTVFWHRDEALRGELWAQKLLQKVLGALPESGSESDPFELRLSNFRTVTLYNLLMDEAARGKAEGVPDPEEGDAAQDPVEPKNDER